LAGVLGHEVGHVLERHSAERMTSGNLMQGLARAAGVAGGTRGSQQAAGMVAGLVHKSYGRTQELESDGWGVKIMVYAGYNPEGLLTVMDVLESASPGAGGPEFMSTHPRQDILTAAARCYRIAATDDCPTKKTIHLMGHQPHPNSHAKNNHDRDARIQSNGCHESVLAFHHHDAGNHDG